MMYVRIRPYDKRRGQLVRRYVYGGVKFEVDKGWYQTDDVIAEYLKTVLTFPENPDSKPVFDVSDQIGAEKIAKEEYEAANPERKISEATSGAQKVTVADLKSPVKEVAPAPKEKKEEPEKAPEETKGSGEPKGDKKETKAAGSGKSK